MEKNKLKIAITGASGFIGRHLLEDIDSSGFDIVVITRDASKKIHNLPATSKVVEADLTNYGSLKKALEGVDVLINCAAEVRNAEKLEETNVDGTRNLIKATLENGVSKIIHLSSVGVVGAQYHAAPEYIKENSNCSPKNGYERTKLESERLLLEARSKHTFSLTILRPTNVYGEYHPFNALLNLMVHINKGKIMLHTCESVVNYVYVKDLTQLMIRLIRDEKEHGIVNVGESLQLGVFVEMIAHALGKKANKRTIPQFLINFNELLGLKKLRTVSNATVYDDSKLKTFYEYPYCLRKGIMRTINYYKEQKLIE